MLKIDLFSSVFVSLFVLKNRRILVLNNNNNNLYIYLPKNINLIYLKRLNCLNLTKSFSQTTFSLNTFYAFFSNFLKKIQKPLIKKLIIKGLGLKAKAFKTLRILELKLGFSYPIEFFVPKEIFFFTVIKNTIFVKGFDAAKIGNFLYKIRILKFPNIYKGKGF